MLSDPKQSVEILKALKITSEYAMDKWFCTYGNDLLVINKNLILSILLNYDNIYKLHSNARKNTIFCHTVASILELF